VATARTEHYPHPAALPEVEPSTIKLDLARRDFTINSMAIKLSGQGMFFLIDLFDGEIDLKNGLIRILHDQSFVDDPCRIFRAIRFEQRFEFCLEDQTKKNIKVAIESNLINQLSGDRLMGEIKILLNESNQVKCVDRMRELSVLQTIAPEIFDDDFHWIVMKKIDSALARKVKDLRESGLSYQKIAEMFNLWRVETRSGEGIWHAKTVRDLKTLS